MKLFRQNILLASFLLAAFLITKDSFPLVSLILILFLFQKRASAYSACILAWICLLLWIPGLLIHEPAIDQVRIIEVHQNYAIAQSGFTKVLIRSECPLPYDALIKTDDQFTEISSKKGFFRFDFGRYMADRGITKQYAGDELRIVKQYRTPRRILQEKAENIENEEVRAFVMKVLFNCTDDTWISGGFLLASGFSLAGILFILEGLIKYVVNDQSRLRIMCAINVLMIAFYGPLLIPISILVRRILRFTKLKKEEKCGIWIIMMILLYQKQIFTAGFLFPLCFSLASLQQKDAFFFRNTVLFALQSILYHKISPFQTLFYPFTVRICGVLWLYALIIVFFPLTAVVPFISIINRFTLFTDSLCIYGSVLGAGLPFFLILVFSFYRHEHFMKITFILLLSFLMSGLFHPFAEVCFINVGQGDCILIRAPLGMDNVLIDTGKSSEYEALKAALDARGIHRIDTFFVTHMDSDHCGNMETVQQEYDVRRLISEHEGSAISNILTFHDLNSLNVEDKNQSSLSLVFRMGGLDFVMCGDADQKAEETIAARFPGLSCDILKLSHHGSKTGSCDRFLDTLKPDLAIISSGAYSIYHHPSPETLQRLLKRHIPYLDTKDHGDISILFIGPLRLLICADLSFEVLSTAHHLETNVS